MFDFPVKEETVGTSLYCLLIYLLIVGKNYSQGLKFPYDRPVSKSTINWTLFFIGFFFVTHCLKGDFFHMMEHISNYSFIQGTYNYGEDIYPKIGLLVNKNYFLFRTIVWGGAFCLFCITAKRMNVPVYYAALLLLATHSIIFAYSRATAAMAVYFFGLSFLSNPIKNKKWLSYLLGCIIIYSSMEFHRSAIIMIIMTLMIFIPLRKWSFVLLLILIPLLTTVFKNFLMDFAIAESTDEMVAKKIQHYSEREVQYGISGVIISTLEYASFYIPFIFVSINILFKNIIKSIPISIIKLYKVACGLTLISVLFMLLGSTYITFAYRILFMSMIPMTLIVSKLYQCKLMSLKYYWICLGSGVVYALTKYVYVIYDVYVNSVF